MSGFASDENTDDAAKEERCICNRLICVVKGDTIEIKCNKCKRIVTIHTLGIKNVDYQS